MAKHHDFHHYARGGALQECNPAHAGGGAVTGSGHYARGGSVHSDEAHDRKLIKKMLAEHERKEMRVEGTMRHAGHASGGRLTAKQRNAMPAKSFAGPDRSYPINDKNHARNALARVSQFGSPSLKAKVRAAVHRKYPGIGKG